MTASPAQVVAKLLRDLGLAVAPSASKPDWSVTVGKQPAERPNNFITVYDTGAVTDGKIQRTGEGVRHPTCQVRIRSDDYPLGFQKGVAIQTAFDNVKRTSVTVGSETVKVQAAVVTIPLVHIGQVDEQDDRQVFTVNVQLTF